MEKIQNLIIGAGPAGLAIAGRMRKQNLAFTLLEKSDKIAWSWHQHYDRLLLHTVKELSHLPHLEFPEDYPRYVPREMLVKYLENYAKHFDIQPQHNEEVFSIKNLPTNKVGKNKKWEVKTKSNRTIEAENVVVATGCNRIPNHPTWKNQSEFEGKTIHSRVYKNAKPFKNKKVLVIGMGNTGAELALDLSEHDIDTTISVRSPITIVPRDVNGRPVQITAKQLAKIPFGIGDWLGTQIRKVVIGDLSKYGVPMSKVHPVVQLRETGKTPVIDLGTVKKIKSGKIKVVRDIDFFTKKGIVFKSGEEKEFDVVILATGYKPMLNEFLENVNGLLDKYSLPKNPIGKNEFEGLYFVGFDNYKLGGLLGTIYNDSKTIVDDILKK